MDDSKYGGTYDLGLPTKNYTKDTFKQIVVRKFGGSNVLKVSKNKPLLPPKKNEVRVQVLATNVKKEDIMARQGNVPSAVQKSLLPCVLGCDLIGIIDDYGDNVTNFEYGDKVAVLTTNGSYSEYIHIPTKHLVIIPDDVNPTEGVTLLHSYMSAYQMLTRCTNLTQGQTIMIHGADDPVGIAMLQLGSLMGLNMYGGVFSSKHTSLVSKYGGHPIDYEEGKDEISSIMNVMESGTIIIDAFFDVVSEDLMSKLDDLIVKDISVFVECVPSNQTTKKNSTSSYCIPCTKSSSKVYYSMNEWYKSHHDWFESDLKKLLQMLNEGKIKPTIASTMKLEDVKQAHDLFESQSVLGDIILVMDDESLHVGDVNNSTEQDAEEEKAKVLDTTGKTESQTDHDDNISFDESIMENDDNVSFQESVVNTSTK